MTDECNFAGKDTPVGGMPEEVYLEKIDGPPYYNVHHRPYTPLTGKPNSPYTRSDLTQQSIDKARIEELEAALAELTRDIDLPPGAVIEVYSTAPVPAQLISISRLVSAKRVLEKEIE